MISKELVASEALGRRHLHPSSGGGQQTWLHLLVRVYSGVRVLGSGKVGSVAALQGESR